MSIGRPGVGRLRSWVWGLWAVANAVGIALVVLADDDERLVTLSRDHGPSASEAIGVLVVIAGWVGLDVVTVRSWAQTRWSTRAKRCAAAVAVVGVVALVAALAFGGGSSWIVGATLLGAVQLAAAVSVVPRRAGKRQAFGPPAT